jgi:osmotically-inducible protein OsmY
MIIKAASWFLALVVLTACVPAVIGAGALIGAGVLQERGISGEAADARIQTDISEKWLKYNIAMFNAIEIKVYDRRVLLMGFVRDDRDRADALRLAREVKGVREVIDEIQIGGKESILNEANDRWIAARVDTALTFGSGVRNLNYTTNILNGTVYVIGIARDEAELNRVVAVIKSVSGVKKIISYIEIRAT